MLIKAQNFKKQINTLVTSPRMLGPAIFVGIGAFKTYKDYNAAQEEEKKKTLVKDISILAGSTLAIALINPLTSFFCETNFSRKISNAILSACPKRLSHRSAKLNRTLLHSQKLIEKSEHVIKEAIASTINTLAGIGGAVGADEAFNRYLRPKLKFTPKEKPEETEKEKNQKDTSAEELKNDEKKPTPISLTDNSVFKKFERITPAATTTAERVFSTMTDLPDMKLLSTPMIALTGFSVANTDGYTNKIKKTVYDLLANTLIPTFFVSATGAFVNKKRGIIKYPALLTALMSGAFIGKYTADKLKDKMDNKIESIKNSFM